MAGLYVHIPFCAGKCAYCSFYSVPTDGRIQAYLRAIGDEASLRENDWQDCSFLSVFIGGGTPSVLPVESIPDLLEVVRGHYCIATNAEISCEANPDSFTPALARTWAHAGVNRVSLGLQSANDAMLRMLGRRHDAGQFIAAAEAAKAAGIASINGDMMFGLPGQTKAMLSETVALLHRSDVSHISCYGLQLEEGTPLHRRVCTGELALPAEDETGDMFDHIKCELEHSGYARYEISNYSKPGHQCKHNLNYWANGEYLALGAAAAGAQRRGSMHRYTNPADIDEYIRQVSRGKLAVNEIIPREEEMFESVMLATRTIDGLDLAGFRSMYGVDFHDCYGEAVDGCLEEGLAIVADGCFRLTERGLDMQNSVLMRFM